MAKVRSIFQPVYPEDRHAKAISEILSLPATAVILSVAFVRDEGVRQIASKILANAAKTRVYVGVRNGVTTVQGVISLLRTGVSLYAVDTGYGAAIFHPKYYCTMKGKKAQVIVGSANLTFSGLNNNLEASALLELDTTNPDDRLFLTRLTEGVKTLEKKFPDHCYRIKDRRHAVRMMREGLLEDERVSRPDTPPPPGRPSARMPNVLPRIGLKFITVPKRSATKKAVRPKQAPAPAAVASGAPAFGPLIWEKPKLPKTDLQLLTIGNTPGVLRLTQAGFEVDGETIDQTTYFRTVVFGGLDWADGPKGKEVATGRFGLIINGVFVGAYDLNLSHKPAWEAGQGNYTTGLHWGNASKLIKKPGLIGRTLRLYQPVGPGAPFVIEID